MNFNFIKNKNFIKIFLFFWMTSLYTISIYGRPLAVFLREGHLLKLFFIFIIFLFLIFIYLLISKDLIQKNSVYKGLKVYSIGVVIAAFIWIEAIEEFLHLIEYPILFLLLKTLWSMPWALGVSIFAAITVEGVQYFVPDRVFDVKDIFMNIYAVFLGYFVYKRVKYSN